ncbi:hypothetical protein HQ560_11400 [bacterium]|nr:hypothetical protein [bacterium]
MARLLSGAALVLALGAMGLAAGKEARMPDRVHDAKGQWARAKAFLHDFAKT